MIEVTEETTEPVQRLIYTQAAQDGSNMTGVVEAGIARFTFAGSQINIKLADLPGFLALGATVLAASVTQVGPDADPPAEEPEPEPEPEPVDPE